MRSSVRPVEIVVLAAACAVIQLLFAGYFTLGLYLDVALVVCLHLVWRTSPQVAILSAAAFGLLQDLTLLAPYLGLGGLSKTIVGFAAVQLSRWVSLDSAGSRFLVVGAASVLDSLIIFTVLALFGDQSTLYSWSGFLIKAVLTGAAGAFFWAAYDRVKVPPKDFRQRT